MRSAVFRSARSTAAISNALMRSDVELDGKALGNAMAAMRLISVNASVASKSVNPRVSHRDDRRDNEVIAKSFIRDVGALVGSASLAISAERGDEIRRLFPREAILIRPPPRVLRQRALF